MERREFMRQRTSVPVSFRFLDSRSPITYEGVSRDISQGGLFVVNKTLKKEELGKDVYLEMNLPEKASSAIPFKGRLRWIESGLEERINGFGLEFIQALADERQRLNEYILKITTHLPPKFKSIRPADYKLSEKEKRGLEILDTLRRQDTISKTQISQEVNLNIVTISNYIDEFQKKGLIFEKGLDESSGGRRPSLLELNRKYGFIIGAELNLLKKFIVVVLVDFGFNLIAHKKTPIKENSSEDSSSLLMKQVLEMIEESKVDRSWILGMGLAIVGAGNNYTRLKDFIEEKLKIPVLVENSPVAEIFSQLWQDADLARKENILYFCLDGNLALILRGELYRGSNGVILRAGFNGSRKKDKDEDACWTNEKCLLRQETKPFSEKEAQDLGKRFGTRVAYLASILNPQLIIIGRISEDTSALFFNTLNSEFKKWFSGEAAKGPKVIQAKFIENSVALGGAALVTRDIYSQI